MRPPPFWEKIYAHSYLFRNFIHNGLKYDYSLLSPAEYKRRCDNAILILDQAVDSFALLCKQQHCNLMLVFHPVNWEVKDKNLALLPVLNYARSQGINCVNVLDYFNANGVNEGNLKKYYWPSDGHNTTAGYLLFARSVADQIEKSPPDRRSNF